MWTFITSIVSGTATQQPIPVQCATVADSIVQVLLALIGAVGTAVSLWIGYKVRIIESTANLVQIQTDRRAKSRTE